MMANCNHKSFKAPDGYSSKMPTKTGAWWLIYEENNYERDAIGIMLQNNVLCADFPDIGVYPVSYIQNNLTNVCWKSAMNAIQGCLGEYSREGDFDCFYENDPGICEDCIYGPDGNIKGKTNPDTGKVNN